MVLLNYPRSKYTLQCFIGSVPELGVACYAAAWSDLSKPHDGETTLEGRKAAFGKATLCLINAHTRNSHSLATKLNSVNRNFLLPSIDVSVSSLMTSMLLMMVKISHRTNRIYTIERWGSSRNAPQTGSSWIAKRWMSQQVRVQLFLSPSSKSSLLSSFKQFSFVCQSGSCLLSCGKNCIDQSPVDVPSPISNPNVDRGVSLP